MDREAYIKEQQVAMSTVATVNGYRIRTVDSRFGQLFMVCKTDMAFSTLDQATAYAESLPFNSIAY
jgi:hypothetical protein